MKKLIIIGFYLLALAGCGSDSDTLVNVNNNNWNEGNWNELEWK